MAVLPAAAEDFSFRGHVYEGPAGNISRPVEDVRVQVFGSGSPHFYDPSVPGTVLAGGTTDAEGYFSLLVPSTPAGAGSFPYYHLVLSPPAGYTAVSASPAYGTSLAGGWTVHSYPVPGGGGGDFWIVPDARPRADFFLSAPAGPAPLALTITDNSSGNPQSWSWTFTGPVAAGPGPVSGRDLPPYFIDEPGTVSVTLTVTNDFGSDSVTKTITIPPAPGRLRADFTASPAEGPAPLRVWFTDTSAGDPAGWSWDFDDDGIADSAARNPDHTYRASGTYSVRLEVTDRSGRSDTSVQPHLVTVLEGPPPLSSADVPQPARCEVLSLPCIWIGAIVITGVLAAAALVLRRPGRNGGGSGSRIEPGPHPELSLEVRQGLEAGGTDWASYGLRLETDAGIEWEQETGGKEG